MKGTYRDDVYLVFPVVHSSQCTIAGPAMLEIDHEKKTNLLSPSEQIVVGVILFALLECKGL